MSQPDFFPSSTLRNADKGLVWDAKLGWLKPVFCHNCGIHSGYTPEKHKFLFYICDECEQKYGTATTTMQIPETVNWENLKQEMLAKKGRMMTNEELEQELFSASPLGVLLRELEANVRKGS